MKLSLQTLLRRLTHYILSVICQQLPRWRRSDAVVIAPPLRNIPVSLPRNIHNVADPFRSHFFDYKYIPARHLYKLHDVYVNADAVVFKNLRVFEPSLCWVNDLPLYRRPSVLLRQWLDVPEKVFDTPVILAYDKWADNYYHWMIEALPRLAYALTFFPGCTVLVPAPAHTYVMETLQLLGVDHIYPLDTGTGFIKVHTLYFPEIVYYHDGYDPPLALKEAALAPLFASPGHYKLLQTELIVEVRKRLMRDLPECRPHRKVYVSRKHQRLRRLVNEGELTDMLKHAGFELVCFEGMSVYEQIRLMMETTVICGLHGANLVNIMFMHAGAVVVELMNEQRFNEAYYNLSASFGLHYYTVPCAMASELDGHASSEQLNDADVKVDVQFVEGVLSTCLASHRTTNA